MRLTFLLFVCFFSSSIFADPINVRITKIKKDTFYDTINILGLLSFVQSEDFFATTSGKITYVLESQKVRKGQKILSIDEDVATSSLESAKQAKIKAETDYKNNQDLFEQKFLSKQNLQLSKSVYSKSLSDYKNAIKQYENLVFNAPFEGVIGSIKQKIGDKVALGDFLFSILDQSEGATINFNLPSSVLGKITNDSKVWIENNSNQILGKITSLSPYLSKQTGDFLVKVSFYNSNDLVHNKYYKGFFKFNLHDGLSIPENSLLSSENGNFIYIVDNDIVKKIDVKVSSRLNGSVEIISDKIKEGDLVIIEGLNKVFPSVQVKIIE